MMGRMRSGCLLAAIDPGFNYRGLNLIRTGWNWNAVLRILDVKATFAVRR